jgi:hypothetical protein
VATRRPDGFSKSHLLNQVVACERALEFVMNPEHQLVLRYLINLWSELAEENSAILEIHFADDIMLLFHLQTEIFRTALH